MPEGDTKLLIHIRKEKTRKEGRRAAAASEVHTKWMSVLGYSLETCIRWDFVFCIGMGPLRCSSPAGARIHRRHLGIHPGLVEIHRVLRCRTAGQ